RVRLAGHRPAGGRRRLRARLPRDHGGQPAGGDGGHRRQPADRPRLLPHRSADLLQVTAVRRFLRHRRGLVGGVVVAVMLLAGILAPAIAPYSYSTQSLLQRLKAPSAAHWLGTDGFGRDVLTRVIWGSRVSLEIGFLATGLSLLVGTLLGGTAGYFGG